MNRLASQSSSWSVTVNRGISQKIIGFKNSIFPQLSAFMAFIIYVALSTFHVISDAENEQLYQSVW